MVKKKVYTLGIETSCDETSASVVDNEYNIISNIVFSQQKLHSSYFGVVPELASRTHYEKIHFVIDKALKNFDIKKIDLIAYTEKPGLKGALLIGKTVAKTLGYIYSIATIGIDHLWGHIYSVLLTYKGEIKFPFLSLIISGGHTELSMVYSFSERKILGETRDDAVGEAFDKTAKMLVEYIQKVKKSYTKNLKFLNQCLKQLKYPGGPVIEKFAKYGNPYSINFPKPYMLENYDFSFSGLKTAVLYYLNSKIKDFYPKLIFDVCASFQETVVDTIITKILHTTKKLNCKIVCISGGVSANNYLKKKMLDLEKKHNIKVYFPEINLSTDNAAMIASAGGHFYFNS
ncbi:MAG: tRNA (adenosine(37)-N6)-threonylcarbamoyltransferase complex transferase subunit TsaD [Endomicrobiia bacterium]